MMWLLLNYFTTRLNEKIVTGLTIPTHTQKKLKTNHARMGKPAAHPYGRDCGLRGEPAARLYGYGYGLWGLAGVDGD